MLALTLSLASQRSFDVKALEELAQKRDVAGITKLLDNAAPLSVLKTNGAYETGRFGWHALGDPAGKYVVLSTPLTSEDIGELLFEITPGKRLRYIPEPDTRGARLGRHSLELRFKTDRKLLEARDRVPLSNEGTGDVFLRLGPNYTVSGISADGRTVNFRQIGGILVLPPKTHGSLEIAYSGVVDRPGYAGSIDAKHIQLTNDYWYPTIARLPSAYDLTVAIPSEWTAVGQGERAGEESTKEGKTVKFRMDLPCSYWSFSAESFKSFARKDARGREYRIWSQKMTPDEMKMQSELYEPILRFYEAFAPFPFSGYGAAEVATYGGGALEAYSFATYGTGMLPDEEAHEPAHTWFGGIAGNDYLHSFWNESFAVYCEGLYRRRVPIGDTVAREAAFADRALDDAAYARVPVEEGSAFIGPEASALGYGKGAHVLAMLEELIGPEKMIYATREWLRGHKPGELSGWSEFEATVERLFPTYELRSFFDDWLRKPGAAVVQVSDVTWRDGKVRGRLQKGFWRMPIEFAFQLADGRYEYRVLDTAKCGEDGSFSLDSSLGKPARVLLDPRHRTLRKGASAPSTGVMDITSGWPVYRDPKRPKYLKFGTKTVAKLPKEFADTVLVGNPESLPEMKRLLEKVGISVEGESLSWRGTRVDLTRAGAMAIVPLEGGKQCAVVLGTAALTPKLGRASIALFDRYGRFLTGESPLPTPKDGVFEIR